MVIVSTLAQYEAMASLANNVYLPTFFWVKGVIFLSYECQDFKDDTNTSDPKIAEAETALTFPIPVSGYVSLNRTSLPVLSISRTFTHSFHFLYRFESTYFWKLSSKAATTHIFQSGASLAHKHVLAWDWSFQSTGVRRVGRYKNIRENPEHIQWSYNKTEFKRK